MSNATAQAAEKQKDQPALLGAAIRHRRKAMGKTLVEVAKDAELTTGFISQVERGISSPSLASLLSIAASLQTSIEQLLSVPEEYSEYIQKDKRQAYSLGLNGRLYEKLGPGFAGALFHPSIIHRPPGHVSEKMCHAGEVFCYVMEGQIEYHLGDEVHVMSAGDTIHHDTSKPHYSKVISDTKTVEMWISSTPIRSIPE
ncbi:transcriptional regulator, XRE family with cupin sensor [Aliiroseovarius crassostreae]|uniref:DNA-binding protein n=1 Tax=Aliiroseovarius crassostreae TaxID=154981 RepID=A0A0P7IJ35_9RHOB|nr:XRE family transcriptional regulator [Aliiroseovarius crassostreae]KPN63881.1 DNA-binding protein [Aliiroseovarius crassostreae]SFU48682.1 transcriptional regulator, XRE family with cupin sensor [Aliiroseovarius crassostreae]